MQACVLDHGSLFDYRHKGLEPYLVAKNEPDIEAATAVS